ncbi:MAG TPA: hypothetical protein EYN69_06850 [Flavobacteriales bacterium]|nr:hypothetical protein [Flavobacteriales bacterium]
MDDKEHGPWKHYYQSGEVKVEANYINGLLDGLQKAYDQQGNLIQTQTYDMGIIKASSN